MRVSAFANWFNIAARTLFLIHNYHREILTAFHMSFHMSQMDFLVVNLLFTHYIA